MFRTWYEGVGVGLALSVAWERKPESVVGWDGVLTLLSGKGCSLWELWMGLLLDSGGFSVWDEGLGLLGWTVGSSGGLMLRGDAGCSPPAAADRATDST